MSHCALEQEICLRGFPEKLLHRRCPLTIRILSLLAYHPAEKASALALSKS